MNPGTPPATSTLAQRPATSSVDASASPRPRFASGQARALARSALSEIGQLTLREQAEHARVLVEIGGVKTWWHRALSDLPPFHLVEQPDGSRLLLVWRAEGPMLQVFHRGVGSTRYEPGPTITKHSAIFAELPRHAFVPGSPAQAATFKQLVALRSLLDLAPEAAIPTLHIASATRLIEAIVLEPVLGQLIRIHPAGVGGASGAPTGTKVA